VEGQVGEEDQVEREDRLQEGEVDHQV